MFSIWCRNISETIFKPNGNCFWKWNASSISCYWCLSMPIKKKSENQRFSYVFKVYSKKPMSWTGLILVKLWFLTLLCLKSPQYGPPHLTADNFYVVHCCCFMRYRSTKGAIIRWSLENLKIEILTFFF